MLFRNVTKQKKNNGPGCFMGYFYSLNFVKSQIISTINQIEINSCFLIDEPQKLNQAGNGYQTEVWMRLDVSLKCKQSIISKYSSRYTNKCHMPNTGKLPCVSYFTDNLRR